MKSILVRIYAVYASVAEGMGSQRVVHPRLDFDLYQRRANLAREINIFDEFVNQQQG